MVLFWVTSPPKKDAEKHWITIFSRSLLFVYLVFGEIVIGCTDMMDTIV
jgi:hypothetical protein